jgi:hypothetical protein
MERAWSWGEGTDEGGVEVESAGELRGEEASDMVEARPIDQSRNFRADLFLFPRFCVFGSIHSATKN